MKINTNEQLIEELLDRGVEEIIVYESLKKKLMSGKKLIIKFGVDPTGADLHVGHAVPLLKLNQFLNLGHKVILLIGDYTAMIGDPSGRDSTRPVLTKDEVTKNMKTYVEQASKVLDMDKVEVKYNSEWYGKSNATQLIMELTSKITVARVLERDDFQKRMEEGSDIQMQEILYPLLQGYDSVMLKADVEIGGSDQKFNLLMGRKMQKRYDQPAQDIMTLPILEGTDGKKKMSKSYDNYIGLLDSADEMFGKVMSWPDEMIVKVYELITKEQVEKVKEVELRLKAGENPRNFKLDLAKSVVENFIGTEEAKAAEENFVKVFSKKQKPDEIPEREVVAETIIDALVETKLVPSRSEAKRMVDQKGVKVNDKIIEDYEYQIKSGDLIQKGKRFFVKIK